MFVQLMRIMAANVSRMQAVWQAECKRCVPENQQREALGTMLYVSKEAGHLPRYYKAAQGQPIGFMLAALVMHFC